MPQTTATASHPQPTATTHLDRDGPSALRPKPPNDIMAKPIGVSLYKPRSPVQPNTVLQKGDQLTRVVGSQGRRGILPAAPGRPAADTGGTGAKGNITPLKDAEGKFPCPYCTKSYIHAKHVKRHLLRHTGDRPYKCVLCSDAFSRSDVLKRHVKKCSTRRGNPTETTQLSNSQARVQETQKVADPDNEGDISNTYELKNMFADGMNTTAGSSNHLSYPSSLGAIQGWTDVAPSMRALQPYDASVSNLISSQQIPVYGGSDGNQQSGFDWSRFSRLIATETDSNHYSGATDCSPSDPVRDFVVDMAADI